MKNNEMERTLARMTEMRNIFEILIGKSEGKDYLIDLDLDGILEKNSDKVWTSFNRPRIRGLVAAASSELVFHRRRRFPRLGD
jgi:hypothetical protein